MENSLCTVCTEIHWRTDCQYFLSQDTEKIVLLEAVSQFYLKINNATI